MLTLYHADTAVCAAKVRVVLAEKAIPYESRLMALSRGDQFTPEYLKLNANAVVPTIIHDGKVVTESTVINEYLDEVFPAPPLRPIDAYGRARVHLWTKREDSIHDAINTMTWSTVFRADLMQKPPEQQRARYENLPDPARREKYRLMLEHGINAPMVFEALIRFARLFNDMEKALADGPWLNGEAFTLADAGLISFFTRLEMLQMSGLWQSRLPNVTAWFDRCKARPSFKLAIDDFITEERRNKFHEVASPLWPQVDAAHQKALATL
jgi:glutathione S-transferase